MTGPAAMTASDRVAAGAGTLEWVALHAFAVAVGLLFVLPFVFVALDRADDRPAVADPRPVAAPLRSGTTSSTSGTRPGSRPGGATRSSTPSAAPR